MSVMKNKVVLCSDCAGNKATVRIGNYHFSECGLDTVLLQNIELHECPDCGNVDPVIPRVMSLLRVIALAVITKKTPLTGQEIKYLRKYSQMSEDQFSKLLHTDKTTLSKWENGAIKIGSKSDLLIRAITLQIGPGLKEDAESVIRTFASIDESSTMQPKRLEVQSDTLKYAYA